ncbi:MAG: enoyl-CoA hydratase-related protein [bacterium]
MEWSTVKVQTGEDGALVIMQRPERRNAFNSGMIADLTAAFHSLRSCDTRLIVLTGAGSAFSAGADLDYMKSIKDAGVDANRKDALALAALLEEIYTHPKPVIARVNGPAVGGGLGLICACDMAWAADNAFFAFSEVRLGLVPAVIGPYVLRALGERQARRWMLTGDRIDAKTALAIGLVQGIAPLVELDRSILEVANSLNAAGPDALAACKRLIQRSGEETIDAVRDWTAELIAELRSGAEGQEGMTAFLEKRFPAWKQIAGEPRSEKTKEA